MPRTKPFAIFLSRSCTVISLRRMSKVKVILWRRKLFNIFPSAKMENFICYGSCGDVKLNGCISVSDAMFSLAGKSFSVSQTRASASLTPWARPSTVIHCQYQTFTTVTKVFSNSSIHGVNSESPYKVSNLRPTEIIYMFFMDLTLTWPVNVSSHLLSPVLTVSRRGQSGSSA